MDWNGFIEKGFAMGVVIWFLIKDSELKNKIIEALGKIEALIIMIKNNEKDVE